MYSREIKDKAKNTDAVLSSMDDTKMFGEVLHEVTFNDAVERRLLTDYKVIVLALDESLVDVSLQKLLRTEDFDLNLEDVTKIIGCYKALSKIGLQKDTIIDTAPMHRAVAFCRDIKTSKNITEHFNKIVIEYRKQAKDNTLAPIACVLKHIDGTFHAKQRKVALDWLKETQSNSIDGDDVCKILSNVRCLSEGVDMPTLDAVMFLHPRKSQVDVVQSVGRVMRTAPNKKMGYVILPVTIPSGMEPEEALQNNKKYEVVWQVLNALRSHDERLDGFINRARLGDDIESKIEIIAMSNILPQKTNTQNTMGSGGKTETNENTIAVSVSKNDELDFEDTVNKAIMAKLVKKCGTRTYWEDWAGDIANIAKTHIDRITTIVSEGTEPVRQIFHDFVKSLQDTLNPSVSKDDVIEMLAQHIYYKTCV